MKLGTITKIKVLNRDDDGNLYPKKEWGYCVETKVNGHSIVSPDNTWYGAYQGAYEAAKWAASVEPFSQDPSGFIALGDHDIAEVRPAEVNI